MIGRERNFTEELFGEMGTNLGEDFADDNAGGKGDGWENFFTRSREKIGNEVSNIENYLERVCEKNNITSEKLNEIFTAVRDIEQTHSGKTASMNALLSNYHQILNAFTDVLQNADVNTPLDIDALNEQVQPYRDEMIEQRLQLEYDKMWNADGSLNIDYIRYLMSLDSIEGTPEQIMYVYIALIKTYEDIDNADDMKAFLNACYRCRPMTDEDREAQFNSNPNKMDALDYFQSQCQDYYIVELSPIFKSMAHYYAQYAAPGYLDEYLTNPNLTDEEKRKLEDQLFRAGILHNLLTYGDFIRTGEGDVFIPTNIVNVEWEQGEHGLNIIRLIFSNPFYPAPLDQIDIYGFASGWGLDANCDAAVLQFLASLDKNMLITLLENAEPEAIVALLGMICPPLAPLMEGGAAAIAFLFAIFDTIQQNSDAQNASDILNFGNLAMAMGIQAQICVVDGKLQLQFVAVDMDVFALNFGAFINERAGGPISVEDLLNDPTKMAEFVQFCSYREDKIAEYQKQLEQNGTNPVDALSDEDKELLNTALDDLGDIL